jgi:hypothetical protein
VGFGDVENHRPPGGVDASQHCPLAAGEIMEDPLTDPGPKHRRIVIAIHVQERRHACSISCRDRTAYITEFCVAMAPSGFPVSSTVDGTPSTDSAFFPDAHL